MKPIENEKKEKEKKYRTKEIKGEMVDKQTVNKTNKYCWSVSLMQVWSCIWQYKSLPVFSVQHGVKKLCTGWGFRVSEFCFFLVFSSAKCSSSVSAIFDLWSSHCLFPPSSCHLGFPPGKILNKEILLRDVFCSYLTVLAFFRCEQLKEGTIF
jgi:hypothetical protein